MKKHHHHDEQEEVIEHEIPEVVRQSRRRHGFLRHLVVSLIINICALLAVTMLIKGIDFAPGIDTMRLQIRTLLVFGVLIGLANAVLKPILKFFTFPLIILTLGLTLLVINMFIFWLVVSNIHGLVVTGGFSAYFWGSIIFSIVNTLEHWFIRSINKS